MYSVFVWPNTYLFKLLINEYQFDMIDRQIILKARVIINLFLIEVIG